MTEKEMRAYQRLFPESSWVEQMDGTVRSTNKAVENVTQAEIDAMMVTLQEEWDAEEYARQRQTEYPTIEECVHAMLDNDNTELDTLQAKRAEIKLKYPKGG